MYLSTNREKRTQEGWRKKKEYTSKWFDKISVEKRMIYAARTRAKVKGLEFNISEEDIVVPEFCPYLGFKLERSPKVKSPNSPSLDRIDNSKGYVKGNVQVISNKANVMKQDVSVETLVKFAKAVLEMYDLPHD